MDEAIYYATHGCYSEQVTKEKKRAVWKRAVNLVVEAGEVFMKKKERKVCMYTLICIYVERERQLILVAYKCVVMC